ncbi:crotonase/enoyl-CoA hydratase family protein [Cupriavidus consociatus]|uniref:crotonase/enoyl-CoA hydratase family protein n=1 Tax=Cupriavidus consociatus TaxID=2821357 RepID=UPI001AE5FF87|nr:MULTISPECIES: crotonase/enoyl-CoA hydratase family protein [unclassified Cupriavidus]MBP0623196.1 crotonase/enoyl-CoA hydratase family protein [Cupriavidus sp. LEh25]MDK2659889.1 crotonase/enoyl-CoA hydratase family protein [Cupriavidus sp. LEh21]
MTSELLKEQRGNVFVLTLNRPHARNAMNYELALALSETIDEFERNDDLRVCVITGAAGTFCTGMDLKGFSQGAPRPNIPGRGFGGITETPPKKVMIAAIEGYALAGGFELALACDLLVAADDAKFGLPEVKRGLAASAGGLLRLANRIPHHVAMEYALTGDMLTAARAYELGLLNRVTGRGAALEVALTLAATITQNGPLSVAASKRVMIESRDWKRQEMFENQKHILSPIFDSKDAREGALAFTEKRLPVWTGT